MIAKNIFKIPVYIFSLIFFIIFMSKLPNNSIDDDDDYFDDDNKSNDYDELLSSRYDEISDDYTISYNGHLIDIDNIEDLDDVEDPGELY